MLVLCGDSHCFMTKKQNAYLCFLVPRNFEVPQQRGPTILQMFISVAHKKKMLPTLDLLSRNYQGFISLSLDLFAFSHSGLTFLRCLFWNTVIYLLQISTVRIPLDVCLLHSPHSTHANLYSIKFSFFHSKILQ